MTVEPVQPVDLNTVRELLSACGLPLDGVEEHFRRFLVARSPDGVIVGVVGLELYGEQALLRSLAVADTARRQGVGRRLVEACLARAAAAGAREVYLLTTTAPDYFPRFGFSTVDRRAVTGPVVVSAEFQGACPQTATVMRRDL